MTNKGPTFLGFFLIANVTSDGILSGLGIYQRLGVFEVTVDALYSRIDSAFLWIVSDVRKEGRSTKRDEG